MAGADPGQFLEQAAVLTAEPEDLPVAGSMLVAGSTRRVHTSNNGGTGPTERAKSGRSEGWVRTGSQGASHPGRPVGAARRTAGAGDI